MEVKQRMEELTRELERHNHLYYVLDRPEIADYEYDAMLRELENLEAAHPELASPLSPTRPSPRVAPRTKLPSRYSRATDNPSTFGSTV